MRYLVDEEVRTSFLRIIELSNGMTATIVDALLKLCADIGLVTFIKKYKHYTCF